MQNAQDRDTLRTQDKGKQTKHNNKHNTEN